MFPVSAVPAETRRGACGPYTCSPRCLDLGRSHCYSSQSQVWDPCLWSSVAPRGCLSFSLPFLLSLVIFLLPLDLGPPKGFDCLPLTVDPELPACFQSVGYWLLSLLLPLCLYRQPRFTQMCSGHACEGSLDWGEPLSRDVRDRLGNANGCRKIHLYNKGGRAVPGWG